MKVWAVGVVAFFGLAELYQWFHSLSLPLPVYGVAGLLLALASNAERWSYLLFAPADPAQHSNPHSNRGQPVQPVQAVSPVASQLANPSVDPSVDHPIGHPGGESDSQAERAAGELPVTVRQPAQSYEPARSISFTIRKPQR